jgi:hypothetical protein
MVAGRSRSPLWGQYEGRGATSVSVIAGVAGRSRSPLWAQQEGRSATSVSVIEGVSRSGVTKALLHAQNSLVSADYSVKNTGLGSTRGPDEAMGLDGNRGLGEATAVREQSSWRSHVGAGVGVLEKPRRGGSRTHHEATVRSRNMNNGVLSTLHLVSLHRELFVLCFYPSEKGVSILYGKW